MIVHLVEVCHAGDAVPRWFAKECYATPELAEARLRELKASSLSDPDRQPHLYRTRPVHVAHELPMDPSITQLAIRLPGTGSR